MSDSILAKIESSSNGQHVPEPAPNPFDPARLRLSQDFGASLGIKKALLVVPCRKPSKETFVRCHPSAEYRIETAVLELKDEDRDTYLIAPELRADLSTEPTFGPRLLITTITRQRDAFLWPIRLPGPDGKTNSWNESALEAADMATKQWVRVTPNMAVGGYDVYEASAAIPDPNWSDLPPFKELLRIAFKKKFIDSLDHAVLTRLRGES